MLVYESENPDLLHENMGGSLTNEEPPTNKLLDLCPIENNIASQLANLISKCQLLLQFTCLAWHSQNKSSIDSSQLFTIFISTFLPLFRFENNLK